MVTFNVDSLDFEDDEEARFGTDSDLATRFDSANDRLEVADIANGTVGHIPRGTGTDLIGGKFAETVSEGKALADDGNVYNTIQGAVDNASSWVKVGAGTFHESVTINTAGLTLEGSGERTVINGGKSKTIVASASNITIKNLSVENIGQSRNGGVYAIHGKISSNDLNLFNIKVVNAIDQGLFLEGSNTLVQNSTVKNSYNSSIEIRGNYSIVSNCKTEKSVGTSYARGVDIRGGGSVVSHCIFENTNGQGIYVNSTDLVVYSNRIDNTGGDGISVTINSIDSLVAKNRLINTNGISDSGTGTILDSNLTT